MYGPCLALTRKSLGYPCSATLNLWIDELHPVVKKSITGKAPLTYCSVRQKQRAVIELCSRQGSASDIADEFGVSKQVLYKWKGKLLDEKVDPFMKPHKSSKADRDRAVLEDEVALLQSCVHRLQLEHDLLTKANELLKKDQSVDLQLLSNLEKTLLVEALRGSYPLTELICQLQLPRSSYFYHKSRLRLPDKCSELRQTVTDIFNLNHRCYGYRRIHIKLNRRGTTVSEKVVRHEQLVVRAHKQRRYSSYNGEVRPAPENLINRDYQADAPNQKWLTDITEFQIPAGKIYLSPMIDCFDGLAASWTMGTRPDAELVNAMLDEAIETLSESQRPMVHSDRGRTIDGQAGYHALRMPNSCDQCPEKVVHRIIRPAKAFSVA